MEPQDFNAALDLLRESLSPQEFEEFNDEIRRQLRIEMGPELEAEKKRVNNSYAKMISHLLSIATHWKEEQELNSETVTPASPPPPSPVEIPPAVQEVIRPSAKRPAGKPTTTRSRPVFSSSQDRKMLEEGIITCLRATGKSKLGVRFDDILQYLEKVIHFPVKTEYWQFQGKDKRNRFESAVRHLLQKLQGAGRVRRENRFWYLA